jgi:GalNAc-alpha-(1->4)-GalNAc-alpha-(1->3)-diNAcBac-PP-undecaprenol alpha-1,4-N-acetyl-D-galactosaminyltransferase
MATTKKILFFISSMNAGGAERVASSLLNWWAKRGDQIFLATMAEGASFYELDANIHHIELGLRKESHNIFKAVINNLSRVKKIREIIKKINPDIIISFMTSTNNLVILACSFLRFPLIISERTIKMAPANSMSMNILRRLLYNKADCLVTQTSADRLNYNFVNNVQVIPNPVFIAEDKVDIEAQKDKIILAVGRFNKYKGFDVLIRAFSEIKDKKGFKLLIIGDGELKIELQNLVSQLNIQKYADLIPNQKSIYDYYRKASIFVLASKYEGFPNTLIEAMASGCACVSFDCPYGPREIIQNNYNGKIIEANNQKKLTETLSDLIDNEEERIVLGQHASSIIDTLGITKIINKWDELIREIMLT